MLVQYHQFQNKKQTLLSKINPFALRLARIIFVFGEGLKDPKEIENPMNYIILNLRPYFTMSRLHEFITRIRNCKTMAEERAEYQKEMAVIR